MRDLPVKILIVDDHPSVRGGVNAILGTDPSFRVVGEAGSRKEALDRAENGGIDIMMLDIELEDGNGIDLTLRLRTLHPQIDILIYSLHTEDKYVLRAKAAGARGYLYKSAYGREILDAFHKIARGQTAFPNISRPELLHPELLLTLNEKRVLWLSGHREYDTARIASHMGIVEATVNTHRHNIWQELKAALPEEETSNPNLLVILGVEYRQRCPEYPME
jgi:DNA-binding NarL/FixJ family response regulator